MVTGSIHASHCVTQPIYATVTDNYAHNSMPQIYMSHNNQQHLINFLSKFYIPWVFPEFSRINKFPEISMFSMFSRVVSTLVYVKPLSVLQRILFWAAVVHWERATNVANSPIFRRVLLTWLCGDMQRYSPTSRLLWLDAERKPRTEPRWEPFKRYSSQQGRRPIGAGGSWPTTFRGKGGRGT